MVTSSTIEYDTTLLFKTHILKIIKHTTFKRDSPLLKKVRMIPRYFEMCFPHLGIPLLDVLRGPTTSKLFSLFSPLVTERFSLRRDHFQRLLKFRFQIHYTKLLA